jgi:hypothetical protein
MPCGGIYPVAGSWIEPGITATLDDSPDNTTCFQCDQPILDHAHFCEEWDCLLHRECIPAFLETDEGKIVLAHGHDVIIEGD